VKQNILTRENIAGLLIPLLLIFITQLGGSLFMPDLIRMLGHNQHLLNPDITKTTRNLLLGVAMSIPGIAGVYAPAIMGNFSDRWGRKKIIILSLIASLISLIIPLIGMFFFSFTIVASGGLISGFNACKPLAKSCVIDISRGATRKLYLAWSTLAITLGGVLGPLLGNYLSDPQHGHWFTIQTPYYFYLFIVMITLLIVLFGFNEPKHLYNPHKVNPTLNVFRLWLDVRKERQLLKPLIAFLCFECAYALFMDDIPLFWHGFLQESISVISDYTAFVSGLVALSLLLVYPIWVKLIPRRFQMTVPIIIMSISFILLSFTLGVGIRWLVTIPIAVFAAIAYALFMNHLSICVKDDKYGWLMGVIYTIVGFVWSGSALLMVPLNRLSPHMPLIVTGILGLLSCLLLMTI